MISQRHTRNSTNGPTHIRAAKPALKFYAFKLVLTDWRYELPGNTRNMLLAVVLNNWVRRRCASIAAYLITNRSVYLLIAVRHKKLVYALRELLVSLVHELSEHYRYITSEKRHDYQYGYLARLHDRRLLKLLVTCNKTGIIDPTLRRWQHKLNNAHYSSVIDYQGGTGPVIIRRLPSKRRCDIIDRHVIT